MYAYCIVPSLPVRIGPDHRSEMVSQLLFGEQVLLRSAAHDGWVSVKCTYDGYEGWVAFNQLFSSDVNVADHFHVAADWATKISINGNEMYVPFGSSLSLLNQLPNLNMQVLGKEELLSDKLVTSEKLHHAIKMYLGTGYLWGGKSVFGTDCSGFVQSVFRYVQLSLPRDASQQAMIGETVYFLQEAQLGDLAFFEDEQGEIIHVGILMNDHQIVHAWGAVRIDAIDSEGILNQTTLVRTHKLRLIKRITSFNQT